MKMERVFTTLGFRPEGAIKWEERESKIAEPNGKIIFEMKKVQVPKHWSQTATDILAQKYFRRAGVCECYVVIEEEGVPQWLCKRRPHDDADFIGNGNGYKFGGETSGRQVFHRIAGCYTYWGWKAGYFDSEEDAQTYYDEMFYMLAMQIAAPNSPSWFNVGLNWAYGITGPLQGHYYVDYQSGELKKSEDAYSHPQPHACFIQPVEDHLVADGGIMDLWHREARLFKYGSGTGTNFSDLRAKGEPLEGGGTSSGLMSFLEIGDRAASSVKSGGTTRRAAKMVVVDIDHPEVEDFITWKVKEEQKVASLIVGSKIIKKHLQSILNAADGVNEFYNDIAVQEAVKEAREVGIPEQYIQRVLQLVYQGVKKVDFAEFNNDWNSEAYHTVAGQNSNNSVRIPKLFMDTLEQNGNWSLKWRTSIEKLKRNPKYADNVGKSIKSVSAKKLWDQICYAAWACADPGIQFSTTINDWHTCSYDGEIKASNPCAEYLFLDNTACNLASLNLVKFYNEKEDKFNIKELEHASEFWTIALDISVTMAQFPSKEIAQRSYDYRTLGLGYANLGALLMRLALPYDSEVSRDIAASLTAIIHMQAYLTSSKLASKLGVFPRYSVNRIPMLGVIKKHHEKVKKFKTVGLYNLGKEAIRISGEAIASCAAYGVRNAQVTAIAPTGTIGLVMDCFTSDTLVAVADGRGAVSFGELAKEDKDVDVYACDNKGKIIIKRMRNIRAIRTSPVVEVVLDDGSKVKSTEEHLYMLRNGKYKKAIELLPGDSLKRFDSELQDLTDDGALRRVVRLSSVRYSNKGGSWQSQYQLIGKRLFSDYVEGKGLIHHADGNPLNDLTYNLDYCSSVGEHSHKHWEMLSLDERKEFGKRRVANRDAEKNKQQLKSTKLKSSSQEARSKAALSYPSEVRSLGMLESYKNVTLGRRQVKAKKIWETRRLNEKVKNNHKVVSVNSCGIETTYCGEVEDVKNFAIITSIEGDLQTGKLSGIVCHNCDTTGIEPDYALVKFKKLAGGGYFKIINQSVLTALEKLGYDYTTSLSIVRYVVGDINQFDDISCPVNKHVLQSRYNLSGKEIDEIRDKLKTAFDFSFILPEKVFSSLQDWEVIEASSRLFGTMTIEGAPNLRKEHYEVFDCASKQGQFGKRVIPWEAHIKMLAAVQPFTSGGISKTVNLPNEATIEDVSKAYMMAWKTGVKCIALYRDGSKLSQPLSSFSEKKIVDVKKGDQKVFLEKDIKVPVKEEKDQISVRRMLPPKRLGYTQKAKIAGQTIYLRTGEYEDKKLGEIFIDMHREGATVRSLLNSFAIAVSLGLQHGVPLDEFVDAFVFSKFDPSGFVAGHDNIKMTTSIVDYIFRDLAINYLGKEELAHTSSQKNDSSEEPGIPVGINIPTLQEKSFLMKEPMVHKEVEKLFKSLNKSVNSVHGNIVNSVALGYTGDICSECQSATMVRNGTCLKCMTCGSTTGCS